MAEELRLFESEGEITDRRFLPARVRVRQNAMIMKALLISSSRGLLQMTA